MATTTKGAGRIPTPAPAAGRSFPLPGGGTWNPETGRGVDANGNAFTTTPGASLKDVVTVSQVVNPASSTAPRGGSTTPQPAGGALTAEQAAQAASYQSTLNQYELGELSGEIDAWIRQGLTWDQVWLQLMDPSTRAGQVVDRIYPELRQVREAGLPPVTIADVLNNKRMTIQGLSERGISGYVDARALARQWTVGAVSVREGLARVDAVLDDALAFARNDPETSAELESWERFYEVDLTPADILGMATKPDVALRDLRRRSEAVRFDVEAGRAGFGDLSRREAEGLTDLGVEARQSGGTFGALASSRELFTPLDRGEDRITREEQLAAGFSNSAAATKRIEDRRRRRQAAFGAGGGFAVDRAGYGGLRPA